MSLKQLQQIFINRYYFFVRFSFLFSDFVINPSVDLNNSTVTIPHRKTGKLRLMKFDSDRQILVISYHSLTITSD